MTPTRAVNATAWAGRRVFVTGHTGFKGSWLTLWLSAMGSDVAGYALPPDDPGLFRSARLHELVRHTEGDVRDAGALAGALARHEPEVVLHLAAQALVRPSYRDPVATYATNVMGTVHLLEAVRRTPSVRAVVVVTSDKCYENREWDWGYRETEAMGGADPYSSSKGCAELVTASWRRSFFPPRDHGRHGVAIATARAGNVIGGGDWACDRLVPDALRAFAAGEALVVRYPDAVRPWQHVLDPLAGYLLLAERLLSDGPTFADGWNFGPGPDGERPVRDVVGTLTSLWGGDARWRTTGEPQPHEAGFLKLDCSKARARLGWRPRLAFTEALALTVDWSRSHAAEGRARELTLGQIEAYARSTPPAS